MSEQGENYRHEWRSEPHGYDLYSVNLEANEVYRVLVWDIEHFDHHLQAGPGPSISLTNFPIDPDDNYLLQDFMHGDAHGRPYDYHVRLQSITFGGPEGRGIRFETSEPQVHVHVHELSILTSAGASLAHVFQSDSAGDHTLRIDALAPGMRYHIKIEKLNDQPAGPSALHGLQFRSRAISGFGGHMRYDDYTFGGIAPGDQDWFAVRLDAHKTYAFSLHGGFDWRNLNNPDFAGLAGPDGMIKPWSRNRTTYLDFHTGSVGGDYYIGVQSGSAQGAGMYVLVVEEVDVHPGSRTNVTLSLGQWYVSFYQSSFDQDAFRVNLKADRRYTIVLNTGLRGSTATFQWSQARTIGGVCGTHGCYRSTGTRNSVLDYYEESRGPLSLLVEFSVKTDGEYLIPVNNLWPGEEPDVLRGAYRLIVSDYGPDPPPGD